MKSQPVQAQVFAKRDEEIDSLLRRFKRAVRESGILEEARERKFYEKPSEKKHKENLQRKLRAQKNQNPKQ
jgi:small subunit ribosomal protein S21